jgi:AGCS family alanine or glycine:cation symporter
LFALFTALATFGIGNMTQANSTAKILEATFDIAPWVTGVVLMVLTALVILGGIRSIGKFTSILVPFMIVGYVGASLTVLALNITGIPHALGLIFQHAFSPSAATGGFAGSATAAAMRLVLHAVCSQTSQAWARLPLPPPQREPMILSNRRWSA